MGSRFTSAFEATLSISKADLDVVKHYPLPQPCLSYISLMVPPTTIPIAELFQITLIPQLFSSMEWALTEVGCLCTNAYLFRHRPIFFLGVFKKLLEPAPKHNFRIVSIYRRDYAPSSAYTDEDRALLGDVATGHRKHLRNNGIALAHFLDKFIVQENIPPVNAAGEGGIIPLGWSLGAIAIHALLSSLDGLEPEVLERLNKYISTVIIHGNDHFLSIGNSQTHRATNRPQRNCHWRGQSPPIRH